MDPTFAALIAVVIAYEIVRRYRVRLEQAEVASELSDRRQRTPEAVEATHGWGSQ